MWGGGGGGGGGGVIHEKMFSTDLRKRLPLGYTRAKTEDLKNFFFFHLQGASVMHDASQMPTHKQTNKKLVHLLFLLLCSPGGPVCVNPD